MPAAAATPTPGSPASARAVRVLFVTNMYPASTNPRRGIFVQRQIASIAAQLTSPVEIVHVGRLGAGGLRASHRAVQRAIDAARPDLIHVVYGLSGAAVPLRARMPIVLTLCGSDVLWGPATGNPKGLVEYAISVATAWRSAHITVESATLREALPGLGLRARTSIVPPGVDRSAFQPLGRAECRTRLGWPLDEPVVLFPSDPSRSVKRFGLAQAAVTQMRTEHGRHVRLRVLAQVPPAEVAIHLNAADCVLITSRWEGGPLAFYESLACGTPVVTVPVGYAAHASWRTPHVRVALPDPVSVSAALTDVLGSHLPHSSPEGVEIPSAAAYGVELLEIYGRTLSTA